MGTTCMALASPRPLPSKLPHCLLPDFISCFSPSQCLKQPDVSPELLLFSDTETQHKAARAVLGACVLSHSVLSNSLPSHGL